jgi:hypothetical protein
MPKVTSNNRREFLKTGISGFLTVPAWAGQERKRRVVEIPIVLGNLATQIERLAARELSTHLQQLYPANRFPIGESVPDRGARILLGTLKSLPKLRNYLSRGLLARPGSYVISGHSRAKYAEAVIAGSDAQATLFAVYALLEKLGYGFYLSYNATPPPSPKPIGLGEWRLSDHPLFPERIAFTWHNFLSSCSTWNLGDWEHWIIQLARMRFNTVMVHAYGNNPMFTFTHNGETKPVGYLATSLKGRDWGTEHVNDVRRIPGGEGIFAGPVFGSEAALVPDDQRVQATVSLMRQVFALAARYGLRVTFALDVDTESSNPQNVVDTLPENARINARGFRLANPDVPAGYAYYKSQVRSLLDMYPDIDRIALWMRAGRNTPWCSLRSQDFPGSWRTEYENGLVNKMADLQKDPESPSMFAISKISNAFRKALVELGKEHVKLALGSWNYAWLRAANAFFSSDVTFLPLDYYVGLGTDEVQTSIQAASRNRPVIPIVWAQHDDRAFIGRPYTPFAGFSSILAQSSNAGFGIIHWTTRPLDLYFKSLAEQVWDQTKDQPLEVTCDEMAARTFGEESRELGKQYLIRWITEAPMFGRETTDRFLDHPLVEPQRVITECRGRLAILGKMPTGSLSPAASERLNYFRDLENFIAAFYESHSAWELSVGFLRKGDVHNARMALHSCDPRVVLQQYARAAARGKPTRGEMGVLISMNLKWLPYILSQRQAIGLDSIRYQFEHTEHEPLAQGAGKFTFYFDQEGKLWKAEGRQETQYPSFKLASAPSGNQEVLREICQSGLQSNSSIALNLRTIADQNLLRGAYNLRLLFVCPSSEATADSVFDIVLSESGGGIDLTQRVDVVQQARGRDRSLQIILPVKIHGDTLSLRLDPVKGPVYLCGAMMEPANS